jgi:transposase-like protein
MQVMIEYHHPLAREQTMTGSRIERRRRRSKRFWSVTRIPACAGTSFVRMAGQSLVQAALEAEMTEALGAEKGERSEGRLGYRSGYYSRSRITRVGRWN